MATFKINGKNFATQDGTGAATIHADVVFPSGFPIQVVNKNFPNNYSHSGTSNAFVAVSGFTQTFTLTSSTNKVLVLLSTTIGNSNNTYHTAVRVVRDGTALMDAVGSRGLALGGHQTTYSITIRQEPLAKSLTQFRDILIVELFI